MKKNCSAYRKCLGISVEALLPDDHEAVGEVEHEEDDSSGRSSDVGSLEINDNEGFVLKVKISSSYLSYAS